MNRSDLSEDDHNTSTNSTRGGNGADEVEEADYNSKYVPPKNVPIVDIWNKDSDDPSLNKYKQQLIGSAINIIIEPSDPSRLLLKRLVLIPEDHHGDIIFDLTSGSNLDKYKDYVVRLKENSTYRIKLEFFVQREIISGLKLLQTAYKGPLRTDKSSYMMGSRAPKPEIQEYLSEKETVPSGMMARGKYHMKSSITDDDKNVYAKWEWILEIGKDWK